MRFFLSMLLLGLSLQSLAQKNTYSGYPSLIWPRLYDISYDTRVEFIGDFGKPIFSPAAKSLEGKTITLPGYIMPFEGGMRASHFMLSATPIYACFFCGAGGPESVVEVYLNKVITYTEKIVEIRGKLKLNDSNPEHMFYILEDAEFLGVVDF
ncbi:MAG TPA: hypothetical protein PKC24_12985 [Cyclobacteriaceae bacterium]|nr:hypothetical protein [Cyclobacteriaceae bacterium]